MQTMVFTGRLAADPQISPDYAKAVFRLLEKRGVDVGGKDRIVGVNCVSWAKGLNEKVIARALAKGCEAVVVGAFVDTAYTSRDGMERAAKELVVNRLTVLDWADRAGERADEPDAETSDTQQDVAAPERPRRGRRAAA